MKIPKEAKVKKEIVISSITTKVDVTDNDIKNGIQNDANTCAIARSLKRQFSEKDVEVSGDEITVNGYESLSVPSEVKSFISRFDENKKSVSPFSFILRLVKRKED